MKSKKLYLKTTSKHRLMKLNAAITNHFKRFSINQVDEFIKNGNVYINNQRQTNPNFHVESRQLISIYIKPGKSKEPKVKIRDSDIIYKDRYLIALNKQPGIASDTTRFGKAGTVIEGIENKYGPLKHIQPVHRLDKNTSGILLISLKAIATKGLMTQFQNREVKKTYIALVEGFIEPEVSELKNYIYRNPDDPRKYMIHNSQGKLSTTTYRRIHFYEAKNRSLLLIQIKTGRTHQIRVQMEYVGHPVVGDRLYGFKKKSERMFLHALSIAFTHPVNRQRLKLVAKPPKTFFLEAIPTNLESYIDM